MRVDDAGQQVEPAGVDLLARAALQLRADGSDHAVAHPDVAWPGGAADQQVEGRHAASSSSSRVVTSSATATSSARTDSAG